MSLRVDFTNVEAGGFEPLPEGKYQATVFEVEQRVSASSGKPYLNWQFRIMGGDYDGRRAFYMTSLQPQALWKLKEVLRHLGYSDEELSGEFELDLTDLLGRECTILIGHEQYNGEIRDRVLNVVGPSEGIGDTPLFR